MKTYLVTGGAGFIGSNFVLYMLNKYPDIRILNVDALTYAGNLENLKAVEGDPRHVFIQADVTDQKALEPLFAENEIDYVIHFAAESHVDRSLHDPGLFARTNILGTLNLLDLARRYWSAGNDVYRDGVKYLQVSTDEVYGSLGAEGFFSETTPLDPHSPYSASKTGADLFVKAYSDSFKLPVNITRCSNNYGPFQFPEKLIPLMIHNCLHHKPLPVYGDGMQVRDWLYVEDHCKAIDMVTRQGRPGEVYNVGGHNERTNLDVVKTVLRELGKPESLITFVTDRPGHDRRYAIDPSKIHAELGWLPRTKFDDGIHQTVQWYLDNRQWWEHILAGEYQNYYQAMYGNR